MDVITQDVVTQALNDLEDSYKQWLQMRHTTDAEKELARTKIRQIEHARTQLSELIAPKS